MYEYIGLVSIHILLIWCLGEWIGVSSRLVLANIVTVGTYLQVLLSWCLVEEIDVSRRSVPKSC
jgi:hypothetical protein